MHLFSKHLPNEPDEVAVEFARENHVKFCGTNTSSDIQLEFRESDLSPGKTEVKQGKFAEFISPVKG